ncbi:MAG TPA: GntR family transcriptional regulator [Candidatus Micrarchaeia archaeon]|nr:GntR family transcriptional regulator [Candidatus Micrarchaeia archaeon]
MSHLGSALGEPIQIRRESAGQAIYRLLRDAVIQRRLAPSTRLLEPELAVSLSVSRTPVREALRVLEAEGFVERLPSGGLVVAGIDPQDVRELYDVRLALETMAARQAAQRATVHDVHALIDLLDRLSRLSLEPDEALRHGDVFHDHLAQLAGNRRCQEVIHHMRNHIDRYRAAGTLAAPERVARAWAEHRRVADAIAQGNPLRAARAMHAHIRAEAQACIAAVDREHRAAAHGGRLGSRLEVLGAGAG